MDVFANQLRQFDANVADLHQWYNGLAADERPTFRAWLERVESLARDGCRWGELRVRVEHDDCDEAGDIVRWSDTEFRPTTILAAVRAWDAGQEFTPESIMP